MVSNPDVKSALKLWDAMRRLTAEDRWPANYRGSNTRTLAIAMTYARLTIPTEDRTWDRIIALAGWGDDQSGWYSFRDAISEDAPRYEPPHNGAPWHRPCEAPMIRREGLCGQRGTWTQHVTDPATGRWRLAAWCSRHQEFYRKAWAAEQVRLKVGTTPRPAPNTGGLLALHVPGKDWPNLYAWARSGWEPPELGLNPDHWPALEKVHQYRPPALRALDGGGEDAELSAPPSLRLVGDAS